MIALLGYMGDALLEALTKIKEAPLHYLESPAHQPKRAAVALIIRVRPAGSEADRREVEGLNEFFHQPWVQQGDAEVRFIYVPVTRFLMKEGAVHKEG